MDDKGTEVSKISLCGKRDCKGGYICDEKINYGTKVSVLTDYAVNFVRLDFTEGSECSDGSRAKSTLTIICNDHHLSAPTLLTVNIFYTFCCLLNVIMSYIKIILIYRKSLAGQILSGKPAKYANQLKRK